MIPFNDLASVRKVDNPAIRAIRACVEANGYVGRPITPGLLDEVGAALTRACRAPCLAFHEVDLVPSSAGMVRVRLAHSSGPWVAAPAGCIPRARLPDGLTVVHRLHRRPGGTRGM